MSGIGHASGGDLMYANIVAGKFASLVEKSVAEDSSGNLLPNYRKRVNKNDVTVWEYIFDSVSGIVDRFEIRDTPLGDQVTLSVKFDAGGTQTIVSIGFNAFNESGTMTSYAASIGDQIGLVDFTKELKIALSKKSGKVRGVALEQGGIYIPNSKDNAVFAEHIKERPAPSKTQNIKGDDVWNWEAPSKWQYEQILAGIQRLQTQGVGGGVPEKESVAPPVMETADESLGDVPNIDAEAVPATPF